MHQHGGNLSPGVRLRWGSAAAAAATATPRLQPAAAGSKQRRQFVTNVMGSSQSCGKQPQQWQGGSRPATLHSLRLSPPAMQGAGPRLSPPLRALSPASQPGQDSHQQQHQQRQQHGFATQPPLRPFWARPTAVAASGFGEGASEANGSSNGGGSSTLHPPVQSPAERASEAQARELKAVNTAVVVNMIIFVAKIITWGATGSGAMLAEAMHSMADVANQILLKHGVIRSRRKPTREHQYGFHKEKYVYALISAACVFCIGCGASILHGVSSLWAPHALENMSYSLAVLLGSSFLEAYSLNVAYKMIKRSAEEQNMNVWQYIKRGRDPTTVAILWEDGGAVAGLGLAGGFTVLTWLTGQQHWDALGSIAVGVLMGVIALQLMRTNKRFLIGQAMEPSVERSIVEHLQNDKMVVRVIDPKSEEMGDGVYRFKAEIQWSGEHVVQKYLSTGREREMMYHQIRTAACTIPTENAEVLGDAIDLAMMDFGKGVIRTVGSEIDRLEVELKQMVPGLVYVDLETDKGSGAMGSMLSSVDFEDLRRPYDASGAAGAGGAGSGQSSAGAGVGVGSQVVAPPPAIA